MKGFKTLFFGLMLMVIHVQAAIVAYDFDSDAQRKRFMDLTTELRCPKCQNQSIADSNAPLSQDLREQVYLQLREGKTNEEILSFMDSRYGDFIRYKPKVVWETYALWFGPFLFLIIGLLGVVIFVLRNKMKALKNQRPLSSQEINAIKLLTTKEDQI